MAEIESIVEGTVRVDQTAVLSNGALYTTSVEYSSVSNLRQQDVDERKAKALSQIQSELSSGIARREQEVKESAELFAQLESLYATADEARAGEAARPGSAPDRWRVLMDRGGVAQEAAVKRLATFGNEQASDLLLGFLYESWQGDYPEVEEVDGSVQLHDVIAAWVSLIGV